MAERKYWNEKIETLSRPRLEKLQLKKLRAHLAFAYDNSPWYKKSFDEAGVGPKDLKTLADLRRFPFINKKIERDRQLAAPLLGDMVAVSERDVVFVSASSGTTGVPTLSPFTQKDFDTFQDNEARLFWMVGMRPTDRYVHALNFTLFVRRAGRHRRAKARCALLLGGNDSLGPASFHHEGIPADHHLGRRRHTPGISGRTALAAGIDPAKDLAIRKIIVAGEPGGSIPATRQAIEKLWNAELYDFLRNLRHLRRVRRHVRGAERSPPHRGRHPPRGTGPRNERAGRGRKAGRDGAHNADQERAPDDPVPHRRHRRCRPLEMRLRKDAMRGSPLPDGSTTCSSYRGRERLPERRRVLLSAMCRD